MRTGEAWGLLAQPTLADSAFAFAGGYFDEATGGIPTEGGGAISHYSWSVPNCFQLFVLTPFFVFPPEIRRVIYTTNAIEDVATSR